MIIVTTHDHLGDSACLTGAVYNLKQAYPDMDIAYRGWAPDLWRNLDFCRPAPADNTQAVTVCYGTPHDERTTSRGNPVEGFTRDICDKLGLPPVPCITRVPVLRLTDEEKRAGEWCRGKWLLNANAQTWSRSKWYPYWQDVVDMSTGIEFVQVGSTEARNISRPLDGVIDYRGRSQNLRELMAMAWHCDGILSPPSGIMNIAAAFWKRQVIVNGAREGARLSDYPGVVHVSTALCGYDGTRTGCVSLRMPSDIPCHRPCKNHVLIDGIETARCMAVIPPRRIAAAVLALSKD